MLSWNPVDITIPMEDQRCHQQWEMFSNEMLPSTLSWLFWLVDNFFHLQWKLQYWKRKFFITEKSSPASSIIQQWCSALKDFLLPLHGSHNFHSMESGIHKLEKLWEKWGMSFVMKNLPLQVMSSSFHGCSYISRISSIMWLYQKAWDKQGI